MGRGKETGSVGDGSVVDCVGKDVLVLEGEDGVVEGGAWNPPRI